MPKFFSQDLRFAARMMRRAPMVTAASLLALSIGIGGTTAVFSLVYGVMLRPLPYQQPGRIVKIDPTYPGGKSDAADAKRYEFWKAHQSAFESIAADRGSAAVNMEGGANPERIRLRRVTADFFRVLLVSPSVGRLFLQDEDSPAAAPIAVLGYGLWKRSFGGDPSVVGRSVILAGKSYSIVGVAPAGMDSTLSADAFVPVDPPTDPLANGTNFAILARLKDGVTLEKANADMRVVANQFHSAYPKTRPEESAGVFSYQAEAVRNVRPMLLMLLGAVCLVLLIACANVANLLLARVASRNREIAVRISLGASASRILRQLLTESVLLAAVGSALGLAFAQVAIWTVLRFKPVDLPRLAEVSVDWRIVAFAAALALLTGILFGVAPALQVLRSDPRQTLVEGGSRSGDSRGSRRFRDSLVVAEFSVSVLLLVGALLLVESFRNLNSVDPGFDPANTFIVQMSLSGSRYQSPSAVAMFAQLLTDRVNRMPGITAAATTNYLPLSSGFNIPLGSIEGQPNPEGKFLGNLEWLGISPQFFRAMGMRLDSGRAFDERDTAAAPPVVIVNEAFARTFLPKQNPLGQRIVVGWSLIGKEATDPPREIVGVVADMHEGSLNSDPSPQTYVPVTQINAAISSEVNSIMPTTVIARTAGPTESSGNVSRELVDQVRAIDPLLPTFGIRTMRDVVGDSIETNRFVMWLIGGFAAAALILAAIGVYGVMSYLVARRTREMGIRAALGARPAELLAMVLREAGVRAAIGLALGLAGAFWLSQLLSAFLFGVKARDPLTFVLAPVLLLAIALIATWLPARRAARVEPVTALRYE
ncbi:MAG TPA: ABC transporter permease [Candidatus Acidoferrales bacterium]|nr:ABC transporter permease [Candidatus Acidoferrales bacterium]